MLLVLLLALGLSAQPSPGSRCAADAVESRLSVFADYHQFVVADARSRLRGLAGGWTEEAIERGHVPGADYVAVATARDVRVPVTLRVLGGAPEAAAGWDRVAETALELPSGELVVSAVTDARGEGQRIRVPPGSYRARLLADGLETVSADGLSGSDRYVVELWRAGS
jgi:hypothetical protein